MSQPENPEVPLPVICVPLPRVATVEEWHAGRAFRRLLAMRVNGPEPIRRRQGDPRKDAVLRKLNDGERGRPFATLEELCRPWRH